MGKKAFLGLRNLPQWHYHKAMSLSEALQLLDSFDGKAKIIAGGTDLIPALRAGRLTLGSNTHLIDVSHIRELSYIKEEEGVIKIGAATKLSEIVASEVVRKHTPVLANAISQMGSLQIRNLATIGGNLCNASPAADSAVPLLVLNSAVKLASITRERLLPLTDFFVGPGQTALSQDEILLEIQVPIPNASAKAVFYKLGRRNAFTLSVISVGAYLAKVDNKVLDIRIALGAVAPTPIRAFKAEKYLLHEGIREEALNKAARIVAEEISPISDVRATAWYRREMANNLVKNILKTIAE